MNLQSNEAVIDYVCTGSSGSPVLDMSGLFQGIGGLQHVFRGLGAAARLCALSGALSILREVVHTPPYDLAVFNHQTWAAVAGAEGPLRLVLKLGLLRLIGPAGL